MATSFFSVFPIAKSMTGDSMFVLFITVFPEPSTGPRIQQVL